MKTIRIALALAIATTVLVSCNKDDQPQDTTPAGALKGLFTVNAEGKQVYFAKGNLKYDIKKGEWGFLDKQYEVQQTVDTDLITLFTWGLGEWSTDPSTKLYAGNQDAFVDWGTMIDGEHTWRTLTSAEWQYVLWDRGQDDLKVCRVNVTVCGAQGCIVTAPDGNTVEIKESYTEQEWAEVEAAGFVCLPNAGYRDGGKSIDFSYGGYYWASNQSKDHVGRTVNFNGSTWKTAQDLGKEWGSSVRLVAE